MAMVLAYHAIADSARDPMLRRYSVPASRFATQLDALGRDGWTFIDASTLLSALAGGRRLPPRSVLMTFDDAYEDFVHAALPELERRGIPSVLFAVAGAIGGSNDWDQNLGAGSMRLMDADALRRVAAQGVEIGSHGLTHRSMSSLDATSLASEARESADILEELGLSRPRLFAYPYGQCTSEVMASIQAAGYAAAFSITPGVASRARDLYALPRVMVQRGYRPSVLRLRLALARRDPERFARWFDIIGDRG